jgi:hypothetical protein
VSGPAFRRVGTRHRVRFGIQNTDASFARIGGARDANRHKVLLTAAHIIDQNAESTLYCPGPTQLIQIAGEFDATVAPGGLRDRDHYDFAYCGLAGELAAAIAGRFVDQNEVAWSTLAEPGVCLTALGYPNSKNKNLDSPKPTIRPALLPYSDFQKVDEEIAASLRVSDDAKQSAEEDERGKWRLRMGELDAKRLSSDPNSAVRSGRTVGPTVRLQQDASARVRRGICGSRSCGGEKNKARTESSKNIQDGAVKSRRWLTEVSCYARRRRLA